MFIAVKNPGVYYLQKQGNINIMPEAY